MKKILFLIFTFSFQHFLFAQNVKDFLQHRSTEIKYTDYKITLNAPLQKASNNIDIFANEAKSYVLNHNTKLNNPNISLKLQSSIQSLLGYHFQFTQTYKDIEVYQSTIKININFDGKIISISDNLLDASNWSDNYFPNTNANSYQQKLWVFDGDKLIPTLSEKIKSQFGLKDNVIKHATSKETLYSEALHLGFDKKDTLVAAKIFNPDPISMINAKYNDPWPDKTGRWVDSNHADYPVINNQRRDVLLPIRISNDTFIMENEYAISLDIESPKIPVYSSPNANFDFTRASSTFKEEMVLYHIHHYQTYMRSIGINNLTNYQLHVDAHGRGDDNSSFSFGDPPFYLIFGTGGVPDAEDADVINHEYTHACINSIAPKTIDPTNPNDRLALEEGSCDFIATQFSKMQTTNNWRWFANWDGYFWSGNNNGGRNTNSSKVYSSNLSPTDIYGNSVIWSGFLNDMAECTGTEVAFKLFFSAASMLQLNTDMPQAAKLVLLADSMLYNQSHTACVKAAIAGRALDIKTSIANTIPSNEYILYNTQEFSQNKGDAELVLNNAKIKAIHIYSSNGQLINTIELNAYNAKFKAEDFNSGLYFVDVLDSQNRTTKFKLIKF
jgi:hypothetical protein